MVTCAVLVFTHISIVLVCIRFVRMFARVPMVARILLVTVYSTPCSTVLLEKVTVFQLINKFPAFYGTRRFIAAFTRARHLFLS